MASTLTQQLYSQNHWLADGVDTIWNFTFAGGYLDRSHIKAYMQAPGNGAITSIGLTDANFITDFSVQITPAVPAGYTLVIYRDTPKDEPLVDFLDGARITEQALDTAARQGVLVSAEVTDFFAIGSVGGLVSLAESLIAAQQQALDAVQQAEDSIATIQASEDAAAASATLAQEWAVKLVDPVAGGEYSSKYHAQASAASAAASQVSRLAAETAETNAETAETNAEAAQAAAEAARNLAQGYAADADADRIAAAASESAAAGSASNALNSANAAASSASAASASATAADASADLAASYAASIDPATLVKRDGSQGMTAQLPVVAGSAATPSFAPSTDTNTGLYWPAADQVAVSVGGVNVGTFAVGKLTLTRAAGNAELVLTSSGGSGRTFSVASNTDGSWSVYDATAGVNRIRLGSGGTLQVGDATINETAAMYAGLHATSKHSVNLASGVVGTIFTLPIVNSGTWLVTLYVDASDPANYQHVVLLTSQGPTVRSFTLVSAANMAVSLSGRAVQASQSSGITAFIQATVTRLG